MRCSKTPTLNHVAGSGWSGAGAAEIGSGIDRVRRARSALRRLACAARPPFDSRDFGWRRLPPVSGPAAAGPCGPPLGGRAGVRGQRAPMSFWSAATAIVATGSTTARQHATTRRVTTPRVTPITIVPRAGLLRGASGVLCRPAARRLLRAPAGLLRAARSRRHRHAVAGICRARIWIRAAGVCTARLLRRAEPPATGTMAMATTTPATGAGDRDRGCRCRSSVSLLPRAILLDAKRFASSAAAPRARRRGVPVQRFNVLWRGSPA